MRRHKPRDKYAPIPQTIGQLFHRCGLMRTTETKAAKLHMPGHDVFFWILLAEQGLEVLDQRLLVGELVSTVLRVLGELERVVLGHSSVQRLQHASDEVEEGGLSGLVSAENGNTGVHAAGVVSGNSG